MPRFRKREPKAEVQAIRATYLNYGYIRGWLEDDFGGSMRIIYSRNPKQYSTGASLDATFTHTTGANISGDKGEWHPSRFEYQLSNGVILNVQPEMWLVRISPGNYLQYTDAEMRDRYEEIY